MNAHKSDITIGNSDIVKISCEFAIGLAVKTVRPILLATNKPIDSTLFIANLNAKLQDSWYNN